ncbi:hypothetical protein ARMSODRAFT_966995 [Armillaria solidipes]|uniref:Fe2OG dioxygenase domain-containing protein n=1 Tax=Armillaria solidipes TaxID=1076256 RepID=A0A2H3AWV8_9AGAR|nr:hypothetical protein ARMSODRAFT_966995 [Armillaria solidipes]
MAAHSEHLAVTLAKMREDYDRLGTEYHRRLRSFPPDNDELARIPIVEQTPITRALDKIQSYPFVSFTLGPSATDFNLRDPETCLARFGSLTAPDVEAILEASQPSSFGKGDQTVYDTNYRNGREITAHNVEVQDPFGENFTKKIIRTLCSTLFVGKSIKIALYKLAIYEKGGHFDWHRDSTHGDNHHGTVLIALNTPWEGGGLHLRHNGTEAYFDLHPVVEKDPQTRTTTSVSLQAVAFYTDVEHKVDIVTEGTRLVLQYDVFIQNEAEDPGSYHRRIRDSKLFVEHLKAGAEAQLPEIFDHSALKELSDAISEVHKKGTGEVSIPLRHLYRQASIRPEYLKGVDAVVYEKLSQTFKVSLLPILLMETVFEDDSGVMSTIVKCDGQASRNERLYQRKTRGYESGNDSDTASEGEQGQNRSKKKELVSEFHLSGCTNLLQVSIVGYRDYTGNDAQCGSASYFGGGMFVYAKDSEE